jgi:hypothetical protein
VIGLPSVPFAFDPITFTAHPAEHLVPAEDCQPLFVGEKPLIVLRFDVGNRLKEFPQEKIMPPLDRVLGIRAVADSILVG